MCCANFPNVELAPEIYGDHPRADGAKRRARVLIPRLFTPGETKALAKSKVHQISRAWVTNRGWSSYRYRVILTDLKNMADCHE